MIEELLEAVLEGSAGAQPSRSRQRATPQNPWMDILGEVLQGAGQPQAQQQRAAQPDALGGILEAVLGGGGRSRAASNPLLAPFTDALAERLGISPQMASVILSAAFGLLVGKMKSSGGQVAPNSLNLDDLLEGDFARRSGAVEQVSKQTGMDQETVQDYLREAMKVLGVEMPGGEEKPTQRQRQPVRKKASASQPRRRKKDLKHLLDTWETDD